MKERAQRYSGVKKYMILRLPQRPGALKEFLGILGPDDDIARFEYLKKSARNFGSNRYRNRQARKLHSAFCQAQ